MRHYPRTSISAWTVTQGAGRRNQRDQKVLKSHYLDREDKKPANISPRRYFCQQCHVPQFDAKPLVETRTNQRLKEAE
ncbi:MAG: nitrate reductase cytochrome c-type subunit [Betaproteobacteria bacterium]|nr:nitrate reductase cytochrome c-type subunit [Candidatus Dechloromonas phosphorivorans]